MKNTKKYRYFNKCLAILAHRLAAQSCISNDRLHLRPSTTATNIKEGSFETICLFLSQLCHLTDYLMPSEWCLEWPVSVTICKLAIMFEPMVQTVRKVQTVQSPFCKGARRIQQVATKTFTILQPCSSHIATTHMPPLPKLLPGVLRISNVLRSTHPNRLSSMSS